MLLMIEYIFEFVIEGIASVFSCLFQSENRPRWVTWFIYFNILVLVGLIAWWIL